MESIAQAEVSEIIDIVKPCGLGNTKGRDLVGICQKLLSDFNGQLPDTIEELTLLPGVGRKTANLILGDIFHKPAVVTDAHLIRISNRLGLTSQKNPAKVETELRAILPPDQSSDFCHRIVQFGRDVCLARNPKCQKCELSDVCQTALRSQSSNWNSLLCPYIAETNVSPMSNMDTNRRVSMKTTRINHKSKWNISP